MKIILVIIFILCASLASQAQTPAKEKKSKKELILNISTTAFDFAGMFYDWKQADKYAGTLQGNSPITSVYKCEGNGLYKSGPCYQSNAKYWAVNGSLLAFTSLLKFKFGERWHLLGDTLDIGFGSIHFVSGHRWKPVAPIIGHYPR